MPKTSNTLKSNQMHLKIPTEAKTSGHAVDFGSYTIENDNYRSWISKCNKHEGKKGENASLLEVAFSEVATLFFKPGLTPPAQLIADEGQIIGVASENYAVHISKTPGCYTFNPHNWTYNSLAKTELSKKEQQSCTEDRDGQAITNPQIVEKRIAIKKAQQAVNFLVDMPVDFFPNLMKKNQQNSDTVIDMDSLASILTGSYALEEDDLHKGNIGFYVSDTTNEQGKTQKKFTFFKIDHDLMFLDSIMSQTDMRIANIFYGKDSFKISKRDLDGFPDLQDSGNHYWPTKKRTLVAGDKAYTNKEERTAFASLKDNKEFQQAKWKCFLKYVLIPPQLVKDSLIKHLDATQDLDKINMVHNSVNTRIKKLKQTLVKSTNFRLFLDSPEGTQAKETIKKEIKTYLQQSILKSDQQEHIMKEIEDTFNTFRAAAKLNPLFKQEQLIALDCYSFPTKHKTTVKEIELAQSLFDAHKQDAKEGFKHACIVIDLIGKCNNPKKNKYLEEMLQFKNNYLQANKITSLEQFKAVANKIRESDLPLKQQKNELIAVLKEAKLPLKDLETLKKELHNKEPEDPSLKFIKQLRSDLWLVRKVRGTYGKTSTSTAMLQQIDVQLSPQKTKDMRREMSSLREDNEPRITPEPSGQRNLN